MLPEMERRDFIARVVAENHFKTQIKNASQEYIAPNYYGHFLKRQIEELEAEKEDTIRQGRKIKINSKFLRKLFYTEWQQKLSEGVRRIYRERSTSEDFSTQK